MRKFWRQRDPREKTLIMIAAGMFVLLIGWLLVLNPILAYPKNQKLAYEQANKNLKIIKAGETALLGAVDLPVKTALSAQNFQSTITGLAGKHGLKISRRQPKGDGELTVWLEKAQTTSFYAWVDELTKAYNISANRVNINRNDDGSVRVNITYQLDK